MKQNLITAGVAALVAALVVFVGVWLVGNPQSVTTESVKPETLGASGFNRFPNSGIIAKYLRVSLGPATSTAPADGALVVSGNMTISGDTRLAGNPTSFDKDASIVTLTATATSTLTAAQVCDNPYINGAYTNSNALVTLPTTAAFITNGTCLSVDGDTVRFKFRNSSATTSNKVSILPGTSSTISQLNATTSGVALATSSIMNLGFGIIDGTMITSSSQPWIIWTVTGYQ